MANLPTSGATASGLVYEAAGTGTPTVVLVHAGICDRSQWDGPFDALLRRCRVVRYDVRGFGASPDPRGDYLDHGDLVEVLDAAGVDRAVLVGASNGGRIVLDAAVSVPERVAALVLSGSALVGLPTGARLEDAFAREEAALERVDLATALEVNLRTWVDGVGRTGADPAVRARVADDLAALLPRQAAAGASGEAQLVEPLVRDRLAAVAVPALVLVGEHDQPEMHRIAGYLAAGIPDCRLEVVDAAAHLPDLEQPEVFLRLLTDFLDVLDPTPGAGASA